MDNAEALRQQLANLEHRFQRLQCATGIVLVALAASVLMAAAASNRVVTANEFVLKDSTGRDRAKLAIVDGAAQLTFQDVQGRLRARLGQMEFSASGPYGALLELDGEHGEKITMWNATGNSLIFEEQGKSEVWLSGGMADSVEPSFRLSSVKGKQISLDTTSPNIGVTDAEGFETQMGSASLFVSQTGVTSKTSAASLVLFGKDKKVLWSAPR
jgi:hypothetical protein